ncbi:hypothetical protein MTO96_012896 [Rhipicephalus appendiculatus]
MPSCHSVGSDRLARAAAAALRYAEGQSLPRDGAEQSPTTSARCVRPPYGKLETARRQLSHPVSGRDPKPALLPVLKTRCPSTHPASLTPPTVARGIELPLND